MPIIFPDELRIPKSFSQSFYRKGDPVPLAEMRALFYDLVLGINRIGYNSNDNKLLYSILTGRSGNNENHTFLTNLFQHGNNYRNSRIVSYILDYLYQNDAVNFFLFLHRIDRMWNENSATSDVIRRKLSYFCDDYSNTISWLKENEYDHIIPYFAYVERLKDKKPAYAYGLIVLWTLLNENVMYLVDIIDKIIIYKEDPTTDFQSGKKYIIKSAMNKPTKNESVYLSVRRAFEPLSESEETTAERDILFSVTSAMFHSENSVFTIEKCDKKVNLDEDQSDTEELINEHKAAELLKSFQHLFKPSVPDLSKSLTPSKTEPYYIKVGKKYLTYNSWFAQTRVVLKERPDSKSRWRFAKSPDSVSIFNCGQPVNIFALDIPNGTQTIPTVMWCFPSLSQAAQKYTIHEVIDW